MTNTATTDWHNSVDLAGGFRPSSRLPPEISPSPGRLEPMVGSNLKILFLVI
jgi:hypothetical protein